MSYEKLKKEEYRHMGGINTKVSPYNTDVTELLDLNNMNFITPDALTKRPGQSLYIGATIAGSITGLYEYEKLDGSSYVIATANTNAYTVTSSFITFKSGLLNNGIFDFVTFVDRLFMANGQDFFKFDGTNVSNYSLPYGATSAGITAAVGGGLSGIFIAGYGYLNDRGYLGPVLGSTISLNGITYGSIAFTNLSVPTGYGVTAIAFYRSSPGLDLMYGTTFAPVAATSATDTGWPQTSEIANQNLFFTLSPKYLEIYQNMLFMSGFSSMPSTIMWSDIGEPEGVDPTWNTEVRSNDGDRLTGQKSYNGALIIAKQRSLSRIVGDSPDGLQLQEITDQYGCVSNRCMVPYENVLLFLDSKGVIEFNGANLTIVSTKMEPTFRAMNVTAALDVACAIHYKEYNEIWWAFPTGDSTTNDTIVVFDYLNQSWTKYTGISPASLAIIKGFTPKKTVFAGGYTGSISFFGATFYSDNGSAITCMIDTGFKHPMGQSTEEMFRRFYLNVNPITGITQPISVDFKTNYGSSTVLSRTMYQNPFQSRIDFGLSAKSVAMTITHASASLPFVVNGWTLEGRYQRAV